MVSGKKAKKIQNLNLRQNKYPKLFYTILGARLARLQAMLAHVGSAWSLLGAMLARLRAMLAHFGACFAAYVGPCWPILIHKIEKMGKPQNRVNCRRFVGSAAGLATPLSYEEERTTHMAMPRPREKGQHGTMAKVILTTYQHPKVTFTIGLYRFIDVLACVVFVEATCSYYVTHCRIFQAPQTCTGTQSAGPTETRLWLDTMRSLKKESFDWAWCAIPGDVRRRLGN